MPRQLGDGDSDWEAEFCRVVERIRACAPASRIRDWGWRCRICSRRHCTYIPDFIVQIDDGQPDPPNIVVEIKGIAVKMSRINRIRCARVGLPGVNNLGSYGRWAFEEFRAVFEIEEAFDKLIVAVAQSQS